MANPYTPQTNNTNIPALTIPITEQGLVYQNTMLQAAFANIDNNVTALQNGIGGSAANARTGSAVLAGGTVAITDSTIDAITMIFLGAISPAGSPGALYVSAVTPGSGFTVKSTSNTDISTIGYLLIY